MNTKVLLICKKDNLFCDYAITILKSHFAEEDTMVIRGGWENFRGRTMSA